MIISAQWRKRCAGSSLGIDGRGFDMRVLVFRWKAQMYMGSADVDGQSAADCESVPTVLRRYHDDVS